MQRCAVFHPNQNNKSLKMERRLPKGQSPLHFYYEWIYDYITLQMLLNSRSIVQYIIILWYNKFCCKSQRGRRLRLPLSSDCRAATELRPERGKFMNRQSGSSGGAVIAVAIFVLLVILVQCAHGGTTSGGHYSSHSNGSRGRHSGFYSPVSPSRTSNPTPRPTKPSSSSTKKNDDPYHAKDYMHPDDFYYDHYDDFWDYEEAEDYWNSQQ